MNKLERWVYEVVKSNPWLKNTVRNVYQMFFDILPRKKNYSIASLNVKEGYFFGFHDVSPFSDDETKLLANKPQIFTTMPKVGEKIEVGYFQINGVELVKYVSCSTSEAWNHHKGCRLQWLSEKEMIFNNAFSHKVGSTIYDLETNKENNLDYPIDTVHRKSRIATSFSYERLEKLMPGYGYPYSDDSFLNENAPSKTGLFAVDIDSNSRRLLVSLRDLMDDIGDPNLSIYRHYVTHSEFSNDGRYVSFLHRWVGRDVMKRWSRLIIYDMETESFFALPTDGMVSHYVWNNSNQIIAYCNAGGRDGHVLFNVPDVGVHKHIAPGQLNSDGHQSFVKDDVFITDTYPDKYRFAKIYKVDVKAESADLLVSVYSPKKYQSKFPYNHIACDLHPRVSPSGRYICFDTVFTGIRSIATMKINK